MAYDNPFDPYQPDPAVEEQQRQAMLDQMAPAPAPAAAGPSQPFEASGTGGGGLTLGGGGWQAPRVGTGVTGGMVPSPLPPQPAAAPAATAPSAATSPAPAPGNYRGTEDSWIGYLQGQANRNAPGVRDQGIYQSRPGSGFFHTGGQSVQDTINQFNQATGGHATFVGGPSGDMVDFGDGRGPVDVLNSEGNFWYDEGKGANRIQNDMGKGASSIQNAVSGVGPQGQLPGATNYAGGGSYTTGVPGGTAHPMGEPWPTPQQPFETGGGGGGLWMGTAPGGGTPGGGTPGGGQDLQGTLRQTLLDQMGQFGKPVDENALGIQQPFQAASLAAQREQDRQRTANAEQLYGQGGGSVDQGALSQMNQQGAERNAVGLAGIKAGLIGNEIAAQRTQVAQALQLANSIGARQEAAQLTRQLAELDQKYRYAQMGQQESQFGRNLAQQGSQFGQQLGQQNTQFGRSLTQNQNQWNDTYGLNRQRLTDEQNRLALLSGMNG